jgi:hypothetical protein
LATAADLHGGRSGRGSGFGSTAHNQSHCPQNPHFPVYSPADSTSTLPVFV